jgi:hypothetical protein
MQQARVLFLKYAGTCTGCRRYLAKGAKALFKRGHGIVGCYDCASSLKPQKGE